MCDKTIANYIDSNNIGLWKCAIDFYIRNRTTPRSSNNLIPLLKDRKGRGGSKVKNV